MKWGQDHEQWTNSEAHEIVLKRHDEGLGKGDVNSEYRSAMIGVPSMY